MSKREQAGPAAPGPTLTIICKVLFRLRLQTTRFGLLRVGICRTAVICRSADRAVALIHHPQSQRRQQHLHRRQDFRNQFLRQHAFDEHRRIRSAETANQTVDLKGRSNIIYRSDGLRRANNNGIAVNESAAGSGTGVREKWISPEPSPWVPGGRSVKREILAK